MKPTKAQKAQVAAYKATITRMKKRIRRLEDDVWLYREVLKDVQVKIGAFFRFDPTSQINDPKTKKGH